MTSSFHCIPNSCARISYLVYELQSGIRYRYPDDDDWTVIDGDDYELIAEVEQAENIAYNVRVSATQLSQGVADENGDPTINERYTEDSLWGRYGEIPLNMPNPVYTLFQPNINGELYGEQVYVDYEDTNGNIRSVRLIPNESAAGFDPESVTIIGIYKAVIFSSNRVEYYQYNEDPEFLESCTFKVYKEGQTILELTRDECPDVEVLDNSCQLSQNHRELLIEKLPYLERVDILDQVIESNYIGGAIPALTISSGAPNCLYIYKALITAPSVPINGTALPTLINPWTLVGVLCSDDSSCDPPIYTVHCDCDCQSCPEGTCAVLCGNQMCCYDSNGIAVASIPIEDYCEGNP